VAIEAPGGVRPPGPQAIHALSLEAVALACSAAEGACSEAAVPDPVATGSVPGRICGQARRWSSASARGRRRRTTSG
jgi:hypothetical protein